MRAGLLIVWLQLSVSGFRSVLARGWHGARPSMRTTGVLLVAWCLPSSSCMWSAAYDGHSAFGLLYAAAVWDNRT